MIALSLILGPKPATSRGLAKLVQTEIVGPNSAISRESDCWFRACEVDLIPALCFREDWSWNIYYGYSPLSADSRRIADNNPSWTTGSASSIAINYITGPGSYLSYFVKPQIIIIVNIIQSHKHEVHCIIYYSPAAIIRNAKIWNIILLLAFLRTLSSNLN